MWEIPKDFSNGLGFWNSGARPRCDGGEDFLIELVGGGEQAIEGSAWFLASLSLVSTFQTCESDLPQDFLLPFTVAMADLTQLPDSRWPSIPFHSSRQGQGQANIPFWKLL